MAEKYYLMPGQSVGKSGLPKGKLECGKDDKPLLIKDNLVTVIKNNLPYLLNEGRIKTGSQIDGEEGKTEKPKSTKRMKPEIKPEPVIVPEGDDY